MTLEKERLARLIEYAQQLTRLRTKPSSHVAEHKAFTFYEHELSGLPGITVNSEDQGVWLAVQRLTPTPPPTPTSSNLVLWIEIPKLTLSVPKLKLTVRYRDVYSEDRFIQNPEIDGEPILSKDQALRLEDYEEKEVIISEYHQYISSSWKPWLETEKPRRSSIALYSALFNLRQQLEGASGDAGVELVWGVGIGVWNVGTSNLQYPLLTQTVEVELNTITGVIEVRPRAVEPKLEIEWYSSTDNPGVVALERYAKSFFDNLTNTFSPFDYNTYSDLLKTAVSALDVSGIYWPSEASPGDRSIPRANTSLKITNTWLLFARPRSTGIFLQDLQRLSTAANAANELPNAVAALVTEPSDILQEEPDTVFRGLSATSDNQNAKELYFPKPFNDEQVRIIQLLESESTVVVQGPPGTGKTHTIANVICHYLATGKRVLVTSMKDPALAVLRAQLPEEIRPLAIALLSSEHDGMKQFEFAITKIAQEVGSLNIREVTKTIAEKEVVISTHHASITELDRRMKEWANQNLSVIMLDGASIDPYDAALQVTEATQRITAVIPDDISPDPMCRCPLTLDEVGELRDARRTLGTDILYLGCQLPQIAQFPDPRSIVETHEDLCAYELLTQKIDAGEVPALSSTSNEVLNQAQDLSMRVSEYRKLARDLDENHNVWIPDLIQAMRLNRLNDFSSMLAELGADLRGASKKSLAFIARPVEASPGIENDATIIAAVERLSIGKSPFGLLEQFTRAEHKKILASVKIVGLPVAEQEGWAHVLEYLKLRTNLAALSTRWNALSEHVPLPKTYLQGPEGGSEASRYYELYNVAIDLISKEQVIHRTAVSLFPGWATVKSSWLTPNILDELERYLEHHLTKNRLSSVWTNKERIQRVMDTHQGPIIDRIKDFVENQIGNISVTTLAVQSSWSELMLELARIHGVSPLLNVVSAMTSRLRAAGAPLLAAKLRSVVNDVDDHFLPGDFISLWRLRRLLTHLNSLGSQDVFRQLSDRRKLIILRLEAEYRTVVELRTWLKLSEKSSPSVRAALQAYLASITHIGAGHGIRAIRYRRDAQAAADKANPAVPCWIMPHYRVSESLPAELGCFDLVVIDEASQSDFSALPAILRAKKALIVGDNKQVSPEAIGLEESKVLQLMDRYLGTQVPIFKAQMTPERSIYDLFKVVFAKNIVELKEHFRCVGPIIEYSKRVFYNHEIKPLRLPKASERIDPPLVDVLVTDGFRDNSDINLAEINFIVGEIRSITENPKFSGRSIGMVSLLAFNQAKKVRERLEAELGLETILRHKIECGDAKTFQGKERDIMFLSLVIARNDRGIALTRDTFKQRFNVAASRARDRMYLVRSVELEDLSTTDELRRGIIRHFSQRFETDQSKVADLRSLCESDFERDVYDELTTRGYTVTPQVKIGQYRIDLVVESANDNRLAVECDGDRYHGPDKWEADIARQRVLERAGWTFWRCFASAYVRNRSELINNLIDNLTQIGIQPSGELLTHSNIHVEHRVIEPATSNIEEPETETEEPPSDGTNSGSEADEPKSPSLFDSDYVETAALTVTTSEPSAATPMSTYRRFKTDSVKGDLQDFNSTSHTPQIRRVIENIVGTEGPISKTLLAQRVAEHWGISKVGKLIEERISKIVTRCNVDLYVNDGQEWIWQKGILPEEYSTFRIPDASDDFRRSPDQLPPEEIANAARYVIETEGAVAHTDLVRNIARIFGYSRTGSNVTSIIDKGLRSVFADSVVGQSNPP